MKTTSPKIIFICDFCGISSHASGDDVHLIVGPDGACICNKCAMLCVDKLAKEGVKVLTPEATPHPFFEATTGQMVRESSHHKDQSTHAEAEKEACMRAYWTKMATEEVAIAASNAAGNSGSLHQDPDAACLGSAYAKQLFWPALAAFGMAAIAVVLSLRVGSQEEQS